MSALRSRISIMANFDGLPDSFGRLAVSRMGQILENLRLLHFGIVNVQGGAFAQQSFGYVYGGTFPGVSRVLLEGESQECDVLTAYGVVERLNHFGGEPRLLEVVHVDDLLPVGSNFGQVQAFADVDEVQDVLLETTPAKTGK